MKEYSVYYRPIGSPFFSEIREHHRRVQANNWNEAMKIARCMVWPNVATKVKFLGRLNEDWVAEEALLASILGDEYKVYRYI